MVEAGRAITSILVRSRNFIARIFLGRIKKHSGESGETESIEKIKFFSQQTGKIRPVTLSHYSSPLCSMINGPSRTIWAVSFFAKGGVFYGQCMRLSRDCKRQKERLLCVLWEHSMHGLQTDRIRIRYGRAV